MPFIRAKQHNRGPRATREAERRGRDPVRTYYYLVESYRESGKVRQRTLAYLGGYPSVEDALARLPQDIERCQESLPRAHRDQGRAAVAYQNLVDRAGEPLVYNERIFRSREFQERWHREFQAELINKHIPRAERKYLAAEREVRVTQEHIAELEARLVKLQSLSIPSCSAQEIPGAGTVVGTTV
jgi:hypothetical protein